MPYKEYATLIIAALSALATVGFLTWRGVRLKRPWANDVVLHVGLNAVTIITLGYLICNMIWIIGPWSGQADHMTLQDYVLLENNGIALTENARLRRMPPLEASLGVTGNESLLLIVLVYCLLVIFSSTVKSLEKEF